VRKKVDALGNLLANNETTLDGLAAIAGMALTSPAERVTMRKPWMTRKRKNRVMRETSIALWRGIPWNFANTIGDGISVKHNQSNPVRLTSEDDWEEDEENSEGNRGESSLDDTVDGCRTTSAKGSSNDGGRTSRELAQPREPRDLEAEGGDVGQETDKGDRN
jgi:hypothetical protein